MRSMNWRKALDSLSCMAKPSYYDPGQACGLPRLLFVIPVGACGTTAPLASVPRAAMASANASGIIRTTSRPPHVWHRLLACIRRTA
jgi:hypothetical protein